MKEELKPCPFCGETPSIQRSGLIVKVTCPCGIEYKGKFGEKANDVVSVWNTRVKRWCHNIADSDKHEEFRCSLCGHVDRLIGSGSAAGQHCKGCGAEVVYEWTFDKYAFILGRYDCLLMPNEGFIRIKSE